MARFSELEISVLREALDKFPAGFDCQEVGSPKYKTVARLIEAGCLRAKHEKQILREDGPRYLGLTITEVGRDVLNSLDSGSDGFQVSGFSEEG